MQADNLDLDEMEPAQGRGWAVVKGDDLHGMIFFHGGDDCTLGIAPKSLERAKARIREITGRSRGISFARMIRELNAFLTGWVTYFRYAACKSHLTILDGWIRRKLRCVRLKQCKRAKTIADFLKRLGVPTWNAYVYGAVGEGLVASGGQSVCDPRHDRPVVPCVGIGEPCSAVRDVTILKETAGYR